MMKLSMDRWEQLISLIEEGVISRSLAYVVLTHSERNDLWPAKSMDELSLWPPMDDISKYQREDE